MKHHQAQSPIGAPGSVAVNPATGAVFAWHPYQTTGEVSALLDAAVRAFREWRAARIEERAAVLIRIGEILRERRHALATTLTSEMGKPISQSRAEVDKCAALCKWYAENAAALMSDEETSVEAGAAYISFLPLGVILGVMPWNYPLWQPFRAIVPALLAGNGFVLKHAPNCTSTALSVLRVFEAAGAPKGLLSVLNIAVADIGAVIEDDRVAAVSVTGSVRAGATVASVAGKAVKKTVLELGGSDPFIVLADADIDRAVAAAVLSRFQNAGQTCIAAKRIIVEEPIRLEFTRKLVDSVERLSFGDPLDEGTFIGPMARVDLRDELADQMRRSINLGAAVQLDGGAAGESHTAYFKPTVLSGVKPGMAAFDEETFGPLAAIVAAADVEDAIRLANHSKYGLSSAIWTEHLDHAKALARRLETGSVFINGYAVSDPRIPIGGVKKSGYGRELSYLGIREFTNSQVVWANRQ